MANDGRSRLSGSSLQITSCISYCTEPALAVTRTGKFGCNTRSTASTSSHSIKRGCLISFGHGTEAAKETVNYHWALKRRKQNSRSVHANVVEARRATHCQHSSSSHRFRALAVERTTHCWMTLGVSQQNVTFCARVGLTRLNGDSGHSSGLNSHTSCGHAV
jgi:hypothetical protein